MTQKSVAGVVTKFFYNPEDRLERVEDGSGTVIATYYYDPFGRRLWKEVGGVRTNFHYSDEGLIGEYDATGAEIKTYGYKPGSTWTTDPLFMKQGGEYYFYQNDHLGTPQKLTTINGAVVWSAKYSSFGEAEVDPSLTITNNLRFAGQYFDNETGLHYNYNRYYEPGTGRYITSDSVGLLCDGILADVLNHLFVYSNNNPSNLIDPEGTFPFHGNFCGPGYGDLINDRPWKKSRDVGLDRCCYKHDLCYKNRGVEPPYGTVWCDDNKSLEQLSCDRKLCSCLRIAQPPFKYIHNKWALRKAFGCIKPENIIEIPLF